MNEMALLYHFNWRFHRNDRVPKHGMKTMEFANELRNQFHGNQTSYSWNRKRVLWFQPQMIGNKRVIILHKFFSLESKEQFSGRKPKAFHFLPKLTGTIRIHDRAGRHHLFVKSHSPSQSIIHLLSSLQTVTIDGSIDHMHALLAVWIN
jgi:hypothetical protein